MTFLYKTVEKEALPPSQYWTTLKHWVLHLRSFGTFLKIPEIRISADRTMVVREQPSYLSELARVMDKSAFTRPLIFQMKHKDNAEISFKMKTT